MLGWAVREPGTVDIAPSRAMEIVVREFPDPVDQPVSHPTRPAQAAYEPGFLDTPGDVVPPAQALMELTPVPIEPVAWREEPVTVAHRIEPQFAVRVLSPPKPVTLVESAPSLDAVVPVSNVVMQQAGPLYDLNPTPSYPRLARERGWQGTTWLRVEVKTDGSAGRVEILKTSGHPLLDETSMRAVRAWRFNPATRNNQAVVSWVEVPIRFELVSG
jgi:protein TonB